MNNLITFVSTQLTNVWTLCTNSWLTSGIIMLSLLSLIANLVINFLGNRNR